MFAPTHLTMAETLLSEADLNLAHVISASTIIHIILYFMSTIIISDMADVSMLLFKHGLQRAEINIYIFNQTALENAPARDTNTKMLTPD